MQYTLKEGPLAALRVYLSWIAGMALRELSFFTGRGRRLSVMAGRQFFLVPPFVYVKKIWSPLCLRGEILVPPLAVWRNSGPPKMEEHSPLWPSKNFGPHLWNTEKNWSPPFGHPKKFCDIRPRYHKFLPWKIACTIGGKLVINWWIVHNWWQSPVRPTGKL